MIFSRKTELCKYALCIITPIFLLVVYYQISPFVYTNNDDLYRKMIVSGEISGTPDAHLFLGNYLLGLLLKVLYTYLPLIPWYGLFMCFCIALCMGCVLYRILPSPIFSKQTVFTILLFSFFSFFLFFRNLVLTQFTVIAGITGSCALFWAFTIDMGWSKKKKRFNYIILYILAVSSFCIREEIFFLLLPFAGILWIARFYSESGDKSWAGILNYFKPIIHLVFLLVLLESFQAFGYRSDEWQDFMSYHTNRITLLDYTGFPEYESNMELYSSLGITQESYTAMSSRYMFLNNPDVTGENFAILAEYAQNIQKEEVSPDRLLSIFLQSLNFYTKSGAYGQFILILYPGVILYLLISGKSRKLLDVILLFAVRSSVWMYILFQGRYPERITQTLLIAELFCLAGILLYTLRHMDGKKTPSRIAYGKYLLYLLLLCCVFIGLINRSSLSQTVRQAKGMMQFNQNYVELKAYLNAETDKHYLVDLYAVAYYTEPLLTLQDNRKTNFLTLGGWITLSPLTDARLDSWGIEDSHTALLKDPDLYIIFGSDPSFTADYFHEYYESKFPGCYFTQIDTLECSQGASFYFYSLLPP